MTEHRPDKSDPKPRPGTQTYRKIQVITGHACSMFQTQSCHLQILPFDDRNPSIISPTAQTPRYEIPAILF